MKDEMAKKTTGIKVLGWIIIVFAINELITEITLFYFVSQDYIPRFLSNYAGIVPYSVFFYFLHVLFAKHKLFFLQNISAALPFIYGVLFLISAIGLFRLKNWARKLMIICLYFLLICISISLCYRFKEIIKFGKVLYLFLYLFKTLILLYPIIYLTRPKVREQFK